MREANLFTVVAGNPPRSVSLPAKLSDPFSKCAGNRHAALRPDITGTMGKISYYMSNRIVGCNDASSAA